MEDEEFIIVETPEGDEIEFPSTMTDAEISAAMRQIYPSSAGPGIGVTPAPADNPAARTGDVLGQADAAVREIQDVEARDLDARKGARDVVVRDPANNPVIMGGSDDVMRNNYVDPRTYDPDASFMDYMDFSDADQQAPILLQRGAAFGAGDELLGVMATLMGEDGGEVRDVVNEYYSQAYEDSPIGSLALELGGSIPSATGLARMMGGLGVGPRYTAATEGAIYGFNDPFTEGDGLFNRSLNAVGGGLVGRFAGGIGAGGKNQLDRQINTWSGVDTIQRVADEEFGITLTEGQIKRDPKLRGDEDLARKGALGSESANRAGRESFQAQNEAATRAARALGGDTYSEANQAAEAAASGIRSRIDQRRGEITEAYDRAASYGAEMTEEGVRGLPNAVVSRLEQRDVALLANVEEGVTDASLFPALKSAMASVRRMSERAGERGGPLAFQAIEDERKRINQLINSATNPEDKAAVVRLKKAYDRAIDDAVDNALFNGDSAFIGAYRDARELNAKFQREWGANKVFERIVEREARPEEVINFILGGSRVAGDKNYDVLLQLKGALSEDPEAWAALQEAYVKKTFNQLPKDFGPQRTLQLLDEMLVGRNQSFAQILFDDDQYQQMRRFRSVVESMVPPDGSINYSNSGILVQRMRTSANDMMTGLHATPGVRAIGRTIMGALDKFGVETQGRRIKRQLNPPRGLDTRRIESGFPEQRFAPRAVDLPGAGAGAARQPRSLQEGIEQAARGEPTTTTPSAMAEAMNGPQQAPQRPVFGRRQPEPEVPPQAPDGPPSRVTEPIPESAYGGGPRNAERMNIPQEPTTLTSAVRNMGGIKTRYTSEGVQKNLSRGEFEGIPGLINDRSGKGADDMVRALQEDGFDIASEDDLYRALDNERMGVKTYRIGEGEAYEMELDSYEAMLAGDDPVQNGIPSLGTIRDSIARLMGDESGSLFPNGIPSVLRSNSPNQNAVEFARGKPNEAELLKFRKGQIQRDIRSVRKGSEQYGARPDPEYMGSPKAQLELDYINARLKEISGSGGDEAASETLPMDEASRMARAREMGFDTDTTLYHGTGAGKEIEELIPSRSGEFGPGVYLTDFAPSADMWGSRNGGFSQIIPAHVRGNLYKIDKQEWLRRLQTEGADGELPTHRELQQQIKDQGFDGIEATGLNGQDVQVVIFDPKNIRSKYAKFDPAQSDSPIITNGIPEINKKSTGAPGGSGIRMQNSDGTPTAIGKIYELSNSINPETDKLWTRAEIADEMMISRNQVSVTMSKLRRHGYDAEVAASVSELGKGQKTQMAVELKRQGLSNREIADRINSLFGKDAVHGGNDTTPGAISVMLSQARGKMRGEGKAVDFGMGLALPSAAASMMLTEGEQSEEETANLLGTEEEKRAAMARAMLGGY